MTTDFAPGLHIAAGRAADVDAYDRWTGRWSRLFVPSVLAAAEVGPGQCVLDVSTGTGEAALMALPMVGASGAVVGVDIAPAMLESARSRLNSPGFLPVAADGQALPFRDGSFDAVFCQLGLMFFPDPARGLAEFRRVLRRGRRAAVCVISTPDRAPMWSILAEALSGAIPKRRDMLHLSFALADLKRLESLFANAGFGEVVVQRSQREDTIESFDAYWEPIEAGMGSMPQVYLALQEAERRRIRDEVRARLAPFESGGRLRMSVEMLIGVGRA